MRYCRPVRIAWQKRWFETKEEAQEFIREIESGRLHVWGSFQWATKKGTHKPDSLFCFISRVQGATLYRPTMLPPPTMGLRAGDWVPVPGPVPVPVPAGAGAAGWGTVWDSDASARSS